MQQDGSTVLSCQVPRSYRASSRAPSEACSGLALRSGVQGERQTGTWKRDGQGELQPTLDRQSAAAGAAAAAAARRRCDAEDVSQRVAECAMHVGHLSHFFCEK